MPRISMRRNLDPCRGRTGLRIGGTGSQRPALFLVLLTAAWAGCADLRKNPASVETSRACLLEPAGGDTIAGIARLRAAVWSGCAVRRVVFVVDGQPVDTLDSPPWEAAWLVAAPESGRSCSIGVEARLAASDGGDDLVRSPESAVWALPDRPPSIRILGPGPLRWIEYGPDIFLEAEAADPEEGPLPADRLRWSVNGSVRSIVGSRLPLSAFGVGRIHVTVEATDSWGMLGRAGTDLVLFRYRAPVDPEACLWNVAAAFRSGDLGSLTESFDGEFRFIPCAHEASAAGWPLAWTAEDMAERLGVCFKDPRWGQCAVQLPESTVATWDGRDGRWAWASFRLDTHCPDGGPSGDGETASSVADLLLVRRRGDSWKLEEWRDLPTGGGLSFASLLARTAPFREGSAGTRRSRFPVHLTRPAPVQFSGSPPGRQR